MAFNNHQQKADYYPWFDWLRITLAFVVLLSHEGLIDIWNNAGNFAVQVFFALSGWLIGGILLNIKKTDLPRFYFNRALRIWIPYFFALILLITASLLHDAFTFKWLEFVFYKFSFVYNLFGPPQLELYRQAMPLQGTGNHFWSVNAEEQFYLLSPLVLVLVPTQLGKNILTWLVLAVLAWLLQIYASIVLGVLAAVTVKQFGNVHLTKPARFIFSTIIVISAVELTNQQNYMLIAPLCAISIVMLLATKGKQTSLGTFVGGMSYPLYMNQWIGTFVINALFKHFNLHAPSFKHVVTILLSLVIAGVIYWFIDKRVLLMRPKLYTEKRGELITIIAYASVIIGIVAGLFLRAN
jgi:peptidoglycan/LPS O-acetylase OafA/YrhL